MMTHSGSGHYGDHVTVYQDTSINVYYQIAVTYLCAYCTAVTVVLR